MLNKIFANPIALTIGDQTVKFCSLQDFEFALIGRDAIPADKVCTTMTTPPARLKDEAEANRELEEKLTSILVTSTGDAQDLHTALKELESARFSRDHKWRDIINGLKESPLKEADFYRIALAKYIQYLKMRTELIALFNSKKKGD